MAYYKIARLILDIRSEDRFIHDNLNSFRIDKSADCKADIFIAIKKDDVTQGMNIKAEPIISSVYMRVYKLDNRFIIRYNQSPDITACVIDSVTSIATIYVSPEKSDLTYPSLTEQILLSLRDIFFTLCPGHGLLPVHSSSIIFNDLVFLFSAPSGTGKTTHTNLWLENTEAKMFNGDVCILSIDDNKLTAYGIPWCGSSRDYINASYEVGAVIFLKRGSENRIMKCSPLESVMSLTARSFASNWTKYQVNGILNLSQALTKHGNYATLYCTPNVDAMNVALNYINHL